VQLRLQKWSAFRAEDGTGTEVIKLSLKIDLERGLKDLNFFRAHRASPVNLRHVKEIRPTPRCAFQLTMDDAGGTQIEVKRTSSSRAAGIDPRAVRLNALISHKGTKAQRRNHFTFSLCLRAFV